MFRNHQRQEEEAARLAAERIRNLREALRSAEEPPTAPGRPWWDSLLSELVVYVDPPRARPKGRCRRCGGSPVWDALDGWCCLCCGRPVF